MRVRTTVRTATLAGVFFLAFNSFATAQDEVVGAGRLLFLETAGDVGCASCHRDGASGDVGPNIQGRTAAEVRAALAGGVKDISFIDLTVEEIDQVADYLAFLLDATGK